MRQMLEKAMKYGVSTVHIFMYFKVACDTTDREKLLETMKEFKITWK
jgi:hypothetical protein